MFRMKWSRRGWSCLLAGGVLTACNTDAQEVSSVKVGTKSVQLAASQPAVAPIVPATQPRPAAAAAPAAVSQTLPKAAPAAVPAVSPAVVPALAEEKPAAEERPANVTFTLKIVPHVPARVRMGGKRFGVVQPGKKLEIVRPRDSGPLDLLIRSQGFLTVHTRGYTFEDSQITVRLTRTEEQETLYGYRKPLPPQDAGVPEL